MRTLQELARRRRELHAQVQHDRALVAQSMAPLAGAIRVVDRGSELVRWVRERPMLLAAAAAVFLAVRPKGVARWVRYGLGIWQAWRWLSSRLRDPQHAVTK